MGETKRIMERRGSLSSGVTTQHFAYDAYNRLAEAYTWDAGATTWDSNAQSYSSSWTYSASGRVVSATHDTPVSASGALSYSYSASHPHAATSVGGDTFTYDDAGRMTGRTVDGESSTLEWDPLSNLLEVDNAEYMYDAAGQRYARSGRSTAESATVWVGDVELTDPDRYYPASMEGARFYTFGSATVAYRDDAGITTMLGDVQGSAKVAVAPDGTVSRNAYTPYGVTRASDELEIDRGWLGQVEDGGTGLTYLNARYYDPAIGRFLSPDPLMDPGDPRTLDPYRYADNNPVSFSDASGLRPTCASGGARAQDACFGGGNGGNAKWARGGGSPGPAGGSAASGGGSGNSSWTDTAMGVATSGGQSYVNYLGGVANGAIGTVNTAMYLSGPNHFAGWVSGRGVTQFPTFGIWGDYETQRWFSYLGSGGFFIASAVPTGGAGAATSGGRTAVQGAKAAVQAGWRWVTGSKSASNTAGLEARARALQGVLDPIAQSSRTAAALGTREGQTVLAGGGRDLSPLQRALVQEGEIVARAPGVHAEVTAVNGARSAGLTPQGIGVSRPICPACQGFLEESGATITSPSTAWWFGG